MARGFRTLMENSQRPGQGLFGSLRRLGETFLGLLHNRLELFAFECQEEKHWLIVTLLWCAAAIFFGASAVLLVVLCAVYFTRPPARGVVLLGLCLLFIALAIGAVVKLRSQLQARKSFSSTLQEVEKDIARLRGNDGGS
jgi:uncharacterized membrane protein YqjE